MEQIEKDVGIRKRNLKLKGSFRPCIILIIPLIINDMLYNIFFVFKFSLNICGMMNTLKTRNNFAYVRFLSLSSPSNITFYKTILNPVLRRIKN